MTKGYDFITLGCKVNAYESEGMALVLDKIGYHQVKEGETPSVMVINTCTVTGTSDKKSRQMIHRAIKNQPNAIICVVGCYSQLASEQVAEIPGVNIVLGTNNRSKIGEYLLDYLKNKQQIIAVSDSLKNHDFDLLSVTNYHDTTRAYLKVQDGCNNFCSYCIVPYARGPIRSRDKDIILKEAQTLVDQGFQELVLTGIHTAGYGLDLEDYSFADLLTDLVSKVKGLKRLRISSIEESEIDDKIIDLLKNSPIIVNHLHIPLQAGCDKTLKQMRRKYTLAQYEKTINKIRAAKPDIAITTDVIVGFPGESEADFEDTKQFIQKINFTQLHVFPYSSRAGTPAALMPNQIDPKVKKERVLELIKLSNEQAKRYARLHEDKLLPILFETYDENTETLEGHAPNYMRVKVKGKKELLHTIKNVRIKVGGFPLSLGELEE
ncbi:MAG: tRNA (N(6)-L-threonylcarbamoyladenosine(37)-C(2))-methylthiotransferase MtaB [Bacilli bacterium]|nr:tRNA (N(6)-L-threonylcarbamoyladenosine(37)-C(2))-methylthiotransferase MtaB [Bacilli bacterium]MDD4065369.1 tRNA (N(6)-L-threonylcarbamoyladenosine(37)-C(2))-methylthiotransferase MtaB [Bacilli bacterium]